jgi:hypothetical protein
MPAIHSTEVQAAVGAVPGDLDGSLLAGVRGPQSGATGPGRTAVAGNGSSHRAQRVVDLPRAQEAEALGDASIDGSMVAGLIPIQMEGDGPLVVREKLHVSRPMTIDQALLEMELVGHDFYLFHDSGCGKFSVVYRRRGYDYGVIRLVEEG